MTFAYCSTGKLIDVLTSQFLQRGGRSTYAEILLDMYKGGSCIWINLLCICTRVQYNKAMFVIPAISKPHFLKPIITFLIETKKIFSNTCIFIVFHHLYSF
jgi:hypothetical protein